MELARKAKQDEDELYEALVARFQDVNADGRTRWLVVRVVRQATARYTS